jgi:hypothetical protein
MGNKPSEPSKIAPPIEMGNKSSAPSKIAPPIYNNQNTVEIKTKEITEIIKTIIPVITETAGAAEKAEDYKVKTKYAANAVSKKQITPEDAKIIVDLLDEYRKNALNAVMKANPKSQKLIEQIEIYKNQQTQMQKEAKIISAKSTEAKKEFVLAEKRMIDATTIHNPINKEKEKQIRLNAIKSKRISLESKNALEVKSRKKADDVGEMSYLINELDKLSKELINKIQSAEEAATAAEEAATRIRNAVNNASVAEPEALESYGGRRKQLTHWRKRIHKRKSTHRKRR